jgi:hypothetical protein
MNAMTTTAPSCEIGHPRSRRIGISLSKSDDLARLGLMERHLRVAVREIARLVLTSGGTLVYGADLRDDGYVWALIDELHHYPPAQGIGLSVCLHWKEHRRRTRTLLVRAYEQLGISGELVCLDEQGQPYASPLLCRPAAQEAPPEPTKVPKDMSQAEQDALSSALNKMRRHLTHHCDARLLIGGKRIGYMGAMPGLLEEAQMAVAAGQPVFLAGGFGGITLHIAARVDAACEALMSKQVTLDAKAQSALQQFDTLLQGHSWAALNNGLTDDQNRQLATTHRPSEIAALVAYGLGQISGTRQQP